MRGRTRIAAHPPSAFRGTLSLSLRTTIRSRILPPAIGCAFNFPGRYRALTALILLGPWTPLLFQGQEFGASKPFLFFTDVGDQSMKEAIRKGRFKF